MTRLILSFAVLVAATGGALLPYAEAHHAPWHRSPIYPVEEIYIRGIRYNDHSRNTSAGPNVVQPGGFVTINTRSLLYSGTANPSPYQIRVVIQDASRPPNSFGVTAYQLTNVSPRGTTLTVQMPDHPALRNKTYHLTVFLIGPQPMHYAYAGTVKVL